MRKRKILVTVLGVVLAVSVFCSCNKPKDDAQFHFEIVSKGFQHEYWQAVKKGAENKAEELGVSIEFVGPETESDIVGQVELLEAAIDNEPDAIGFSALSTNAALVAIERAQNAGIPIIGFDSGVPGAPEGWIIANCSTDNYNAGAMSAEGMYDLIKERILASSKPVRIGIIAQDAVSESIINRGRGFIEKMAELCMAEGKTVHVEGNEKYTNDINFDKTTNGADVILEVAVPKSVDSTFSQRDVERILNKADTIGIYGSNQHSGEALVYANETLQKLGTDEGEIVAVAFDSGAVILNAVREGIIAGAVTQAPVAMGEELVETLYAAATGKEVKDVEMECQWYTAENMDDREIRQKLYE